MEQCFCETRQIYVVVIGTQPLWGIRYTKQRRLRKKDEMEKITIRQQLLNTELFRM